MSGYFHRLAQRSLGGPETSPASGVQDSAPPLDAFSLERDEVVEDPAAQAGGPVSPFRGESDRGARREAVRDEAPVPLGTAEREAFRAVTAAPEAEPVGRGRTAPPGARLAEPAKSYTLATTAPRPDALVPPHTVATRSSAVRAAGPPPAPFSRDDGGPRRDPTGSTGQREDPRNPGEPASRPVVAHAHDPRPARGVEVRIGTVSVEIYQVASHPVAPSPIPVHATAPPPRRERFSPSRHYLRLG